MSQLIENSSLLATVLLAINVLVLNLLVLSKQHISSPVATEIPVPTVAIAPCDAACQDAIAQKVRVLEHNEVTPAKTTTTVANAAREWYIPLGSGQSSAQDWEPLSGVEATIDTRNYPAIKRVVFESYISIPTANGFAFAKLYNVTKQHDVWFSEVSMETDKVTKREATITLDPGVQTYRVMMKSSMGYEAKLHNARLKIITE